MSLWPETQVEGEEYRWREAGELTVGDVDARWDARASKGEDIQGSEVRGEKLVLLKGRRPGQLPQQLLSTGDQPLELRTHGLVDHGHEACGEAGLWFGSILGSHCTSPVPPRITFILNTVVCSSLAPSPRPQAGKQQALCTAGTLPPPARLFSGFSNSISSLFTQNGENERRRRPV